MRYAIWNDDSKSLVPLDGWRRLFGDKDEVEEKVRSMSSLFPVVYYEVWEIKEEYFRDGKYVTHL